jgi:hypothetical protein
MAAGRRKIVITFQPHTDGMMLHGTSENGLNLKIILSTEATQELADFFQASVRH